MSVLKDLYPDPGPLCFAPKDESEGQDHQLQPTGSMSDVEMGEREAEGERMEAEDSSGDEGVQLKKRGGPKRKIVAKDSDEESDDGGMQVNGSTPLAESGRLALLLARCPTGFDFPDVRASLNEIGRCGPHLATSALPVGKVSAIKLPRVPTKSCAETQCYMPQLR